MNQQARSLPLLLLALWAAGCGTDEHGAATLPTDEPPVEAPTDLEGAQTLGASLALKAYEACDDDSDCEGRLECIDLLGSRICSVVGCANNPELCVVGETCVVSPSIAPDGVCAFTGTDQYCARHCRDPLVCNLNVECTTRGCCGTLDVDGCPTHCRSLDEMNCEISPQCPSTCCME